MLFDVAILWAALIYLPAHFDSPLREVIRAAPDAGIFIAIAIGIAILRGTTRTILLLRNPRPALRDNLGDATKADNQASALNRTRTTPHPWR